MTCPSCERIRAAAEIDIQNLQAQDLANKRLIGKLKRELEEHQEKSPHAQAVKETCEAWKEKCGHEKAKTPLNGERAMKVRARLGNGYTKADLLKAVEGAAMFPYVVNGQRAPSGKRAERFDDLELICRNEKTVERFMDLADRTDKQDDLYATMARKYWFWLEEAGLQPTEPADWRYKAFCPVCKTTDRWGAAISVEPGECNDFTDALRITCANGCDRTEIAAAIDSRRERQLWRIDEDD